MDVITLGEILADFLPDNNNSYFLKPGGAPSNVAVNLARLGVKSGIIAKVGNDFLGEKLLSFLKKNKVDISNVSKIKKYKTGLVFVFIDKKGERSFSFYGEPSADQFLSESDINENYIKKTQIFHFGSISMIGKQSKKATLKALKISEKYKKIISYDPNIRVHLWDNKEKCRKEIIKHFKYPDIIKMSIDEFEFLFKKKLLKSVLDEIFGEKKLIFITLGKKGSYVKYKDIFLYEKSKKVKVIDTTGAGDAFMAGVLKKVIDYKGIKNLDKNKLRKILIFANKIGGLAVTKKGAV